MDLACLDHSYFHEELQKLTRLIFDVKRERFERRGATGTDHEWSVLEQIDIQLDNLWILNDELVQFDIKDRLNEVYGMAETLFKIKTGKLENDFVPVYEDQMYEFTDFDANNQECFDDYDTNYNGYNESHDDFYEAELTFSKKNKAYRMKNKKK